MIIIQPTPFRKQMVGKRDLGIFQDLILDKGGSKSPKVSVKFCQLFFGAEISKNRY